MNNTIEERFNPPFAVYENLIGNYIVRPLDWEGIWNPDGKLVGGNSIVSCPIKEDAEMIADTFNRFFKLLDENKELRKANDHHQETIKSMREPKQLEEYHLENIRLRNDISNKIYTINALSRYLIKNGMNMEDILKIVEDFKDE